jgi:hypothetical protein
MNKPGTLALVSVVVMALGCGGPVLVNQGDFPPVDDPGAPPLPTDYDWGPPKREDLNKDGKPDLAYYGPDGKLKGGGYDENGDGRVDVYKMVGSDGKVVQETRDTDHDGVLDQRSIDTNGDGTLDQVIKYTPKK